MLTSGRQQDPDIPRREKLVLAGLYLAKYDKVGLKKLGFESFVEAFNAIGYALGSKPASVKNYRDEFDPLFPNKRKGWHKRSTREYCLAVYEKYKQLDIESFAGLVGSFFGFDANNEIGVQSKATQDAESGFAQRLITGLAAERYFEIMQPQIAEFRDYIVENTTKFGYGYDFRLRAKTQDEEFLAVEVKGIRGLSGSLAMTPKEHGAARSLKTNFFLFVVRNFRETPTHEIFQDPLSSRLQFRKVERVIVQTSWLTSV